MKKSTTVVHMFRVKISPPPPIALFRTVNGQPLVGVVALRQLDRLLNLVTSSQRRLCLLVQLVTQAP